MFNRLDNWGGGMQFRLMSAMILFVGSYLPLALILLVQDVQKKFLDAPFCGWTSRSSCTFQILGHPGYAWSCVFVTGLALLITQWGLRRVKLRFEVKVVEAKSIPNDLINYVFPYVVSFMGLGYEDSGKMMGFAVFLAVLFVITYRSGQIVMNPFLFVFGWKIYEAKVEVGQNNEVRITRVLKRGRLLPGKQRAEAVQDFYFMGDP
jgi:hypothetical protein